MGRPKDREVNQAFQLGATSLGADPLVDWEVLT
jgi:hypothetical protein